MKKKINQKNKIIIISAVCFILISTVYFIFFRSDSRDFRSFNSNGGRMGNSTISPETEAEINSFFVGSPSDSEIENYCSENPMYCGYYCRDNNVKFCENFKFEEIPPNETGKFNRSR